MHDLGINASLQLLPLDGTKHPYAWVDEVIVIIQASGLPYEIGPFSTSVEGSYARVRQLVDDINEYLVRHQCAEWILQVQYQVKSNAAVLAADKTGKYR